MNNATETDNAPVFQLAPERVAEIRDLLAEIVAPPLRKATAADAEHRAQLTRCRDALTDLLNERDALVKANAQAAEELACWTGAL
ncbi:hypothetical protein ACIP2X_18750 [Streptomyces sp. NPDC089424]|uniref:hypothetical protein n=1 Tax=Streptomyces sp. NPDC089424 TaxID=3365917 RepID=UPI003817E104